MAAVLPLAWKEQRWAAFAERKLFIRNKNAANRRTASSSGLKKQEKQKNVRHPEVCCGFPLRGRRVVELNVLAEALDGGCEACGAALRLSNCIKETVSGLGSLPFMHTYMHTCIHTYQNHVHLSRQFMRKHARWHPIFFQVFPKNSLIKNIFEEEKKFDGRIWFFWKIVPYSVYFDL